MLPSGSMMGNSVTTAEGMSTSGYCDERRAPNVSSHDSASWQNLFSDFRRRGQLLPGAFI